MEDHSTSLPEMKLRNLGYSLHRYYVDRFFLSRVPALPNRCRILDLGGEKHLRRGIFDITQYGFEVVTLNLSSRKQPDIIGDARELPFPDESFDAVVCAEVLEHVQEPAVVLREAFRVMRSNGNLLASVPFLFRIHAEPNDFGRFTQHYWQAVLNGLTFRNVTVEKQGLFWSVFADMARGHAEQLLLAGRPRLAAMRWLMAAVVTWGERKALAWDALPDADRHPFYGTYTTGFGIHATK